MTNDRSDALPPLSATWLLTGRLGKRMTSFVVYSYYPIEEIIREEKLSEDFAFSSVGGPLEIGFEDGVVIGMGTAFSLNSVIVAQDGTGGHPPLKDSPRLFPVDAKDPRYSKKKFGDLIGRRLEAMSVFKPRTVDVLFDGLPNEIGLSFLFEGGGRFVFGCGLDKMISAPSILGFDEIDPSMLDNYIEIPVGGHLRRIKL